jgi:hypothetical protein
MASLDESRSKFLQICDAQGMQAIPSGTSRAASTVTPGPDADDG